MKLEMICAVLALCAAAPTFAQEGDDSIGQRGIDLTMAGAREAGVAPMPARGESRRVQQEVPLVSAVQLLNILGPSAAFDTSTREPLVIEPRVNSVRVRYGSRAAVILRPDGHGHFVSRDGQMSMRVAVGGGEAHKVQLTMPANWQ